MQTTKSRPGSLDARKKPPPATSKTAGKLKIAESDSGSSTNPITKTTKDQRVIDRRSPRVLAVERPSRVSELEAQISQLQEELKKAKDQLSSSERAEKEEEDAKKQLAIVTEQFEETQKELKEISECEDARVRELRKISQDRDRAWQSELEAIQKQHTLDSSALASAISEMHKLKIQLDRAYQSEAAHSEASRNEIQSLKQQLHDSREYEAMATEEAKRTKMQIDILKTSEETLQAQCVNAMEAYNSLMLELKQSTNKVNSLEELIANLQSSVGNERKKFPSLPFGAETSFDKGEYNESHVLNMELSKLKNEMTQLRAALEAAERKYRDDHLQGALQIRNAKSESSHREVELEARLKECRDEADELRTQLVDNNGLKSDSAMEDLKARLLNTEMQLQIMVEENEMLKSEIARDKGRIEGNGEALAIAVPAKVAEQEVSTMFSLLSAEADESCREAAQVTEQLNTAQAVNSEMEAELRRLRVQCDQWRKAAEAATAMLSTGKYGEKTSFLDYRVAGSKMSSLLSEDSDDESLKKKNGNMLRRIGVLLKKGQK